MPPKSRHNCTDCDSIFPSKAKLQAHIKSTHGYTTVEITSTENEHLDLEVEIPDATQVTKARNAMQQRPIVASFMAAIRENLINSLPSSTSFEAIEPKDRSNEVLQLNKGTLNGRPNNRSGPIKDSVTISVQGEIASQLGTSKAGKSAGRASPKKINMSNNSPAKPNAESSKASPTRVTGARKAAEKAVTPDKGSKSAEKGVPALPEKISKRAMQEKISNKRGLPEKTLKPSGKLAADKLVIPKGGKKGATPAKLSKVIAKNVSFDQTPVKPRGRPPKSPVPGPSSVKTKAELAAEAAAKFVEYECFKCGKAFTTSGSHKRHENACKATSKIIAADDDDEVESDDMEIDPPDIDSEEHSSSDDENCFTKQAAFNNISGGKAKSKETFSKRIYNLLKETETKRKPLAPRKRKSTCKKCNSKYYKEEGCQDCLTDETLDGMDVDNILDCYNCGEIFPDDKALKSHASECFARPGNEALLLKNAANSKKKEQCATCGKKFPDKIALLAHLGTHTGAKEKDKEKPIECNVCLKQFSRKYHLDRHLLLTACSGQVPPSHVCQVCGKAYTRKDNLREHLRAHAGEVLQRKKYKCNECNKEFHGTSLLKIHYRTHTGEKPYNCDFCPKAFNSGGALTKHRRIHTGEKPYECMDCGVSFSLKGTLNRHMRIHTGVRPHKCDFCGKEFIQAGGLKAHMFYHTGQNGFKCPDCGKLFNRKARLEMHTKYVHEKLKDFKCNECDKGFTRKEDLLRHSVLHTGDKPHQCPTCHKRFSIKPSLKLHLLTHTKEEPRSCHECGRAFIRKDCLLRHMRKRHRDLLNKILMDEKEAQSNNPDSPTSTSRILTEQNICDSIRELLSLLVDEATLKGFGWPDKPVDELLESVIKRCGHTPVNPEDYSYMDRLRENSKLLFTVVIDDNAVKTLLNNQTVDEVILHVLRLAKS